MGLLTVRHDRVGKNLGEVLDDLLRERHREGALVNNVGGSSAPGGG